MKKIMTIILAAILLGISAVGMTGCFYDVKNYFISDKDFIYIHMSNFGPRKQNADCYAIVGTNPQGLKTKIYVPAYYKGKEVWYTWIEENWTFAENRYGMDVTGANSVYFPYTHKVFKGGVGGYIAIYQTRDKVPEYCFFVNSTEDYARMIGLKYYYMHSGWYDYDGGSKGNYVTKKLYEYEKEYFERDPYTVNEINGYKLCVEGYEQFIQIANTSYMFNYEGEPNEGYFFINEFERGGLIEDTPYEPQRAGYKFAGWYKEAACINAWDFERDRLPQAEYDTDGNLKFIETKLYAKWVKN